MATANLNPVFTSLSGSVGSLVFYKRYGTTVIRAWVKPANPRTQAQQANRGRFRQAMASWQSLSIEEKTRYNRNARTLRMTGHNLYIRQYMTTGPSNIIENRGCGDGFSLKVALSNECAPSSNFALSNLSQRDGALSSYLALSNGVSSLYPTCPSVTAPSMQWIIDYARGFTVYQG